MFGGRGACFRDPPNKQRVDMSTYKFSKKLSRKVHLLSDGISKTYCKIENSISGKKLMLVSDVLPEGREICSSCEILVVGQFEF